MQLLMFLIKFSTVLILFFYSGFCVQAQDKWKIEKNAIIAFAGKRAEGSFSGLAGTILFSPDSLSTSYFDVVMDVATIETGNNLKNKHAKNESWFFVAQFPKISYKSERIRQTSGRFIAEGVLEIRGARKDAQIIFDFERKNGQGVFTGEMSVNRKDFGIEGNIMAFVVGEYFDVLIEVPVTIISE